MATARTYLKLFFFVLLPVALAAAGWWWYGGVYGSGQGYPVETYFTNPVNGLDTGCAVRFRGVKVGSVGRISFIGAEYPNVPPEDRQTIRVEMILDKRILSVKGDDIDEHFHDMIMKGVHARLAADAVTGATCIEMDYPKANTPRQKISWKPRLPCVPPAPGVSRNSADSARRILGQLDRIDIVDAWTNLLSAAKTAGSALGTVDGFLESRGGNVGEILENLRDASISLRAFAEEIRANPSSLFRENPPLPLDETR